MAEVQETISRPAPYIEAFGKALTEQTLKQIETPVQTGAFAPQVVGVDPFTQAAQQRAATAAGLGAVTFDPTSGVATGVAPGTGVAAYQPFIQQAQQYAAPTGYQAFMSPYQQDVIDTTLQEYDIQAAKQRQGIGQAAIQAGAFGGGREGVALAEYQTQSDRNRALLEAQLRQQGFTQAQAAAQAAFQQQTGLAGQVPGLEAATAQQIGQLGSESFAYRQAVQDAAAEAQRLAQYEPYQRLGFAQDILSAQYGGGYGTRFQETPTQSPLQQALGAGIASAGIVGALRK